MSAVILIIEQHNSLRQTLHWWLRQKFPECRIIEATNVGEVQSLVQTLIPQVVITDMSFLGRYGDSHARRLAELLPTAQIVILTFHENDVHQLGQVTNGTKTFISHSSIQNELQPTLTRLLSMQREFSGF